MELRHLQAFHLVADGLSFRRAAERLNTAQPALTRTIKDLEAELGVTLFVRTTRSVALTPAGQIFRAATADIGQRIAQAVALTRNVVKRKKDSLTIGYNDFAINGLLPEIVKSYRTRYPDIQIKLISMYSRDIREQLIDGSIDIGCLLPVGGPISCVGLSDVCIRNERLVAVVPNSHPLARKGTIRLDALAQEHFVTGIRSLSPDFFLVLDGFCQSHGFEMKVIQEADNAGGIIGLVASGLGVALHVDSNWIRAAGGVSILQLENPPSTVVTNLSWINADAHTPSEILDFAAVAREIVDKQGVEYG